MSDFPVRIVLLVYAVHDALGKVDDDVDDLVAEILE
jgi:hypothetical protein